MLFPFQIRNQQIALRQRIIDVYALHKTVRHEPVGGISDAIKAVNDACLLYKAKTKTFYGLVKSIFQPSSSAYATRVAYKHRVTELNKLLDKVDAAIHHAKLHDKSIKKSHSDTEVYIQRKQYTRVISSTRKVKEAEDVMRDLTKWESPMMRF